MKYSPLTREYAVREDDDRVVFPLVNRTGEDLVLIPKTDFEVLSNDGASIILRRKDV